MKTLSIDIKQKITQEHFEEIIVSALEGGSNYWYDLAVEDFSDDLGGVVGEPLSTRIAISLYDNPDFKMNVYDLEDNEAGGPLGELSQKSLLKAIKIAQEKHPHLFHDLFEGTGDADTADGLFQLAVMGEIIFG